MMRDHLTPDEMARAERAVLSNADAYRLVAELADERERADRAEMSATLLHQAIIGCWYAATFHGDPTPKTPLAYLANAIQDCARPFVGGRLADSGYALLAAVDAILEHVGLEDCRPEYCFDPNLHTLVRQLAAVRLKPPFMEEPDVKPTD